MYITFMMKKIWQNNLKNGLNNQFINLKTKFT